MSDKPSAPELTAGAPRLLDLVRSRIRVKRYSLRTETALRWLDTALHRFSRQAPSDHP